MKILVVEDEPRIAGAIKKGLQLEKMVVDLAYDGIEGLDKATEGTYDVILLDLMLPGMNGIEVISNLRKSKVLTPVLMLTALSQIDNKVEGLTSGADDYLTKPFAFEELLARIKALARRPKMVESANIEIGRLVINQETFEVKLNEKRIELSAKEYQLLLFLARNRGKVVSKDRIGQNVWNYEADVLPNTVEVYIKKLRDKGVAIKTVRGFGYKIETGNV